MDNEKTNIGRQLKAAIQGDGAEFYVASQIMLNLNSFVSMAPTSAPDWDLEVTHPLTGKTAKVQVKYRTRYKGCSPHVRLRGGVNFDFLVLVENEIDGKVDIGEQRSKTWFDGLHGAPLNIFPTWVISKKDADELMYISSVKKKGTMIRSFRRPEYLFNWKIIGDALEQAEVANCIQIDNMARQGK